MQPSNCTVGHLSQRKENLRLCKNLYNDCIAASFVMSPNWKQPKWPSVGEWLTKLWDVHTVGYYSEIKGTNY